MSEVYGFCKAGCRYRVPTYDEFARSASIIKQTATEVGFVLEIGKTYKAKKMLDDACGFSLKIVYEYRATEGGQYETVERSIELPAMERFDDYIKIRLCGLYDTVTTNLVYELNGERSEIDLGYFEYPETLNVYGIIDADTEVYLVNEDATVKAEDGDSAFIRYSANADGADFTEKPVSGQSYIGFATGKTAPTDKSGYQWFYLGAPEYDGTVVIEE